MSNPYRLLGVPPTADDETIRHAYLAAIRRCPPERDAGRFAALRTAYESVRDERRRLKHELFDAQMPTLEELFDALVGTLPPRRPSLESVLKFLEKS